MRSAKSLYQQLYQAINQIYDKNESDGIIKLILAHYFGFSSIDIMLDKSTNNDTDLFPIVLALQAYKPVQYIIGKAEFYGLFFELNEDTLIPRPETEELVRNTLKVINNLYNTNKETLRVLDMCTGSGCIAISIACNAGNKVNVTAVDIAENALMAAKKNALNNATNVHFAKQDILNLKNDETSTDNHKWDIIVSNPPYVRISEKANMHQNVLDYEPHLALFVENNDPLVFYKAIAEFAFQNLSPQGICLVEINEAFGRETADLFIQKGFSAIIVKDFYEKDRFVHAHFIQ